MITSEGSEREQGVRMTSNINEKDSRSQGKIPTKKNHTHDWGYWYNVREMEWYSVGKEDQSTKKW
jgi:hypothetical protein